MLTKMRLLIGVCATLPFACLALPPHFVYLHEIDASIIQEIRYATQHNFVGRKIHGYESGQCILTLKAARALQKIQTELKTHQLSLKVFDCYRPQQAVNDFVTWSHDPYQQQMKVFYYPNIDKQNAFRLNYIALRSGHTRGSTVDLTIVKLDTNTQQAKELTMGTPFDFLDPASHPLNPNINKTARHNRMLLRQLMLKNGFKPLSTEWWHFTLRNETYPNTYFNFAITHEKNLTD